ncbi:transglutaminase-like domain-containing protein [Paenibacillus sp. S150]|uniref:transglutaminase-like domain-containing protein n=1 Tax=Paenibacillus sp. S150 TaxID=2749826 RepID=UPI001C564A3E|nr:transglutaminase-like domain-containing protein [Paenibacillus sp. S150]MBW4082583.1 transglutaminase domain-containing protein [Paenibacillus sp. S150]
MSMKQTVFSLGGKELAEIRRRFERKRELAGSRAERLFGVLSQELTAEEEWALKFLYASMPVCDLADYDGGLFLTHARRAIAGRKQVPWGTRVPDGLFLHYVLPLRINNENLEDYQGVIYGELAERTAGLSMADAILEVNYWCHEKATYTGSDLRTLSPLGMIRSARGRCGEESTLAVAALRSIGIPARQCYTPRWAHCDDNHAWVEAWADGKWHYIGACEPEARLDEGWFSGPARRAMLVHTRVPSGYDGPETVTFRDEWHTEINLLDHYAPVRTLNVRVVDQEGTPAAGAEVLFQLYNYAELFPLAVIQADAEGKVSFKTGYGELIVRAVKDGVWDEAPVSAGGQDDISLVLRQTGQPEGAAGFSMIPPPELEGEERPPLPEERLAEHRDRVAEGERMRKAYEGTFLGEAQARELAAALGLPADRVWKVLGTARGNAREAADFLAEHTPAHGLWPLRLLESLNPKDLTDTFRPVLDDYLLGGVRWLGGLTAESPGPQGGGTADAVGESVDPEDGLFRAKRYLLCPRVQFEMLAPYKSEFLSAFTADEVDAFRRDPAQLAKLVALDWKISGERTHMKGKATPAGTFRLKAGDRASVDIMLAALLRSFGIAARLHPGTQHPQYWHHGQWADARLTDSGGNADGEGSKEPRLDAPLPRGTLRLVRNGEANEDAPVLSYRENFSFGRLENGVYQTLLYPFGGKDVYDKPFELEAGDYRLITGVRLQDGTVLGRFHYFRIEAGRETVLAPQFRKPERSIPVLGTADGGSVLCRWDGDGGAVSLPELAGRAGAVLAWIDPRREPSRHLLREAGGLKAEYEAAGRPLLLAVPEGPESADFDPAAYPDLPKGALLLRDGAGEALRRMAERCHPGEGGYPYLYVLDGSLAVRYVQSGYKPGSGKEALQVLQAVCAGE